MSAPESTAAAESAPAPAGRRRITSHHLQAAALPVLTVALIIFFSVLPATSETFFTTANLKVMLQAQSVLVVVAMAALIPLMAGEYDFSVGATAGFASIMAASAMQDGSVLLVGVAIAVAVGLGIGILNGILVTAARVNSVVATLGTSLLISGMVSWKTGGESIVQGIPQTLTSLATEDFLSIPRSFYLAVLVTLGVYYLLRHVPFGRYMDAIGSNRSAAILLGVRANRFVLIAFVIAGALSGTAGMLILAQAGSASPSIGPAFTLPAIAAAFLSVAAIQPGRFNVWGTLVAILFLGVLNSGLNLAGASPFVNDFANGSALIIGVALSSLFAGRGRTAIT